MPDEVCPDARKPVLRGGLRLEGRRCRPAQPVRTGVAGSEPARRRARNRPDGRRVTVPKLLW